MPEYVNAWVFFLLLLVALPAALAALFGVVSPVAYVAVRIPVQRFRQRGARARSDVGD